MRPMTVACAAAPPLPCTRMDAFEGMVGELEYPMFIVTARAGDEPLGCLVGFTTQASIDPPRFIACLSHNNRTYRLGRDARRWASTPCPPTRRIWRSCSAARPATSTDKSRAAPGTRAEGVPVVDRCANWFVGRVLARRTPAITTRSCSSRSPAPPATGRVHVPRAKRIDPGHEA